MFYLFRLFEIFPKPFGHLKIDFLEDVQSSPQNSDRKSESCWKYYGNRTARGYRRASPQVGLLWAAVLGIIQNA